MKPWWVPRLPVSHALCGHCWTAGSVSGCGDHSHDPGVVRVGAHTTSESIQPALQQLRRVLEAFTDIRSYPM